DAIVIADDDARGAFEERWREVSVERRAGRPGRAPETDVAHDAVPERETGCERSSPSHAPGRERGRPVRPRAHRMACAATGSRAGPAVTKRGGSTSPTRT